MGSRGASASNADSDIKRMKTSGKYVVAENSFAKGVSYIENLEIMAALANNIGEAPKTPSGPVNSENRELAQKSIRWYDTNYSESLRAAKAYENDAKNYGSAKVKKLLTQQADRLKENANDAIKNKEWFEKTYAKYL